MAAKKSPTKRKVKASAARPSAAKRSAAKPSAVKPPATVAAQAKRGLDLRKEFGRGGTVIGVARARQLSGRKSISVQTLRRMGSYFARHGVDRKGAGFHDRKNPSAGYIAWLLWGGDAGKRWADGQLKAFGQSPAPKADSGAAYLAPKGKTKAPGPKSRRKAAGGKRKQA